MKNSQLAHEWAQNPGGSKKANNMYYTDRTIYSYGPHFPIAKHYSGVYGGAVLVTTRYASVTTARHKRHVLNAVYHLPIIECDNINATTPEEHAHNVELMHKEMDALIQSAKRARSRKLQRMEAADRATKNIVLYARAFSLPDPRINYGKSWDDVFNAVKKVALEVRAKAAKREAEELKTLRQKVREWARGELPLNVTYLHTGKFQKLPVRLRLNGNTIATSHGAEVPLDKARALYKRYLAHENIKGAHIGAFCVDNYNDDVVNIGCHEVAIKEVRKVLR